MQPPDPLRHNKQESVTALSAPVDRLESFGGRLLHEPALLLSVAYLATSALGLWADYWFYRPFSIPIFEYLQPSDLLVAGLRDPVYLLLVAVGIAFTVLIGWYERFRFGNPERLEKLRRHWWTRMFVPRWRENMSRRNDALWQRLLRISVIPYIALGLILVYTQGRAHDLLRGDGQRVELVYSGASRNVEKPLLLGTTSTWVFVYWPKQRRAEAIAQQSLRSLVYPPITDIESQAKKKSIEYHPER